MNENPFKYNPLGIDQARRIMMPEERRALRERLHIGKPRIAGSEDWEKLRDFRLAALDSEDRRKLATSKRDLLSVKGRTEQQWKDVFRDGKGEDGVDRFTVFIPSDTEIAGMGRAENREGIWELYNLYVEKKFRGIGISSEITAVRLNEIRVRGGKLVKTHIKEGNTESLGNAQSFGFKRVATTVGKLQEIWNRGFYRMVLEDVNAPEVVKRINEVLNNA